MTPKAAASVAVAKPRYIEPMTTQIRQITGIRKRELRTLPRKLMYGSGFGLKLDESDEATAT